MKEFFNEKGHLMLKFIINQFAMSIFGIMMATTALSVGESWLLPLGIFGLLFFYFILLTFVREDGQKDGIKVAGGRMVADRFLALKYCAVASVPGFVIALLNMILCFADAGSSVAGVCNIITRVFAYGMYNPIDTYLFNAESGVLKSLSFMTQMGISYVMYTFFTLAVCFLAYNSGLKTDKKK